MGKGGIFIAFFAFSIACEISGGGRERGEKTKKVGIFTLDAAASDTEINAGMGVLCVGSPSARKICSRWNLLGSY